MIHGRAWHAVVLTSEWVVLVVLVTFATLLALSALVIAIAAASGRMTWREGWSLWWSRIREDLRRK
jgi:hypothetical protein